MIDVGRISPNRVVKIIKAICWNVVGVTRRVGVVWLQDSFVHQIVEVIWVNPDFLQAVIVDVFKVLSYT